MAAESSTAGEIVGIGERLRGTIVPTTEHERTRRRIIACCLPFLALALVAGIVPMLEMARISVSTEQFAAVGFSTEAYRTLTTDTYYRGVAFNTLWFGGVTTLASLLVTVPVAHALEKYDLPFEGVVVTLFSFPNSLPGIVAAFMIIVLFGNTGLVTNAVAFLSGAPVTNVAIATSAIGLFFGYLYSMIPRSMLLLRGTYAEVNTQAEEAARALGAGPLRTFYYVTLPQIESGIIGAAVLTFRTAVAIFGTVLVLKGALNPPVWTLQINRELSNGFNIQMAAALAVVWFVCVFAATFLVFRYTNAEVSI